MSLEMEIPRMQLAIQMKNGILIHVNVSVKIIAHAKDYSWNPSTCICENGMYLKSIVDDLAIVSNEIIYVMDIVPTNVTINLDDKKIR